MRPPPKSGAPVPVWSPGWRENAFACWFLSGAKLLDHPPTRFIRALSPGHSPTGSGPPGCPLTTIPPWKVAGEGRWNDWQVGMGVRITEPQDMGTGKLRAGLVQTSFCKYNTTPGAVRGRTHGLMACRGLGQGAKAGLWLLANHGGPPTRATPGLAELSCRDQRKYHSITVVGLALLVCQHVTRPPQGWLHLWVRAH